jgi:hypothetical protein
MPELGRQLEADRAMRDAARRLVDRDISRLQAVLPATAAVVQDEAGHVAALARANRGKTAGLAAVVIVAVLAFLFRHRIAGLFHRQPAQAPTDTGGAAQAAAPLHATEPDGGSHERPQTR